MRQPHKATQGRMILENHQRSPLFPEFYHEQLPFVSSGNNSDRNNIPPLSGLLVPLNRSTSLPANSLQLVSRAITCRLPLLLILLRMSLL